MHFNQSQCGAILFAGYHRVSFSRATDFANGLKGSSRNYFHESTLVSSFQSAIRIMIEFPLIFGETNLLEVPKIHEIREICSPRKKAPYSIMS